MFVKLKFGKLAFVCTRAKRKANARQIVKIKEKGIRLHASSSPFFLIQSAITAANFSRAASSVC